jgi:hypothetical protein
MKPPPDLGEVIEDFCDAHDRQILGVDQRFASGRTHLLAANTKKFKCGAVSALADRLQGRNGRSKIARGFLTSGLKGTGSGTLHPRKLRAQLFD